MLSVEVFHAIRAALGVGQYSGYKRVVPQLALSTLHRARKQRDLGAGFCLDFTVMSQAPDALHTWIASHVGLSQNGERGRKGMPADAPSHVANDFSLRIDGQRRNGIRFFSGLGEGIGAGKSGNAQLVLRLFVKRFEIVVTDWPIFDGSPGDASVRGLHSKIFLLESPCGGAVSHRASANRCRGFSVALAHPGIDALRGFAIGISKRPRVRKDGRSVGGWKRVLAV